MLATYEEYFERIEAEAVKEGLDDLRLAREEFHNLTGRFEDGEPWFEQRMTMFLDWYLLDRPGRDGMTPVERLLTSRGGDLNGEERAQMEHFTVSLRSLFRILDAKNELLMLEDLVRGGLWQAHPTYTAVGLNKGDVLGARIVFFEGHPILVARSVVLHPPEAHEAIFAIIARAKAENYPTASLVDHLDKMRLKLDRYSNVRIQHVYRYPGDAPF
jgi:hypothetical protein